MNEVNGVVGVDALWYKNFLWLSQNQHINTWVKWQCCSFCNFLNFLGITRLVDVWLQSLKLNFGFPFRQLLLKDYNSDVDMDADRNEKGGFSHLFRMSVPITQIIITFRGNLTWGCFNATYAALNSATKLTWCFIFKCIIWHATRSAIATLNLQAKSRSQSTQVFLIGCLAAFP